MFDQLEWVASGKLLLLHGALRRNYRFFWGKIVDGLYSIYVSASHLTAYVLVREGIAGVAYHSFLRQV